MQPWRFTGGSDVDICRHMSFAPENRYQCHVEFVSRRVFHSTGGRARHALADYAESITTSFFIFDAREYDNRYAATPAVCQRAAFIANDLKMMMTASSLLLNSYIPSLHYTISALASRRGIKMQSISRVVGFERLLAISPPTL